GPQLLARPLAPGPQRAHAHGAGPRAGRAAASAPVGLPATAPLIAMPSVSVVIPVKDGGPLLAQVLIAVREQGELELIVVDSGSTDGSRELAREAGAELIEVAPHEFGHGRTRNLGA